MRKKQIVFLIGNYMNGGVARRSTTLANEMVKNGYSVSILVTGDIGTALPSLQTGVEIVSLRDFNEKNSSNPIIVRDNEVCQRKLKWYKRLRYVLNWFSPFSKYLTSIINDLTHSERFRKFFLLHPHSVVISFSTPFVYEAFCATKKLDCKIIFAEKNASQLENPGIATQCDWALNMLNYADACVFQTYDEMSQYEGVNLKHPVVIRNPIRPDLPSPYFGNRKKVIVNFCRLNEQKNLPLLIEAFEMLHRDNSEYSLEIYGNIVSQEEEKLKLELQKLIHEKGLENSIRILPPCLDVHSKVLDYAMFVSSSDYEGLSNSMLEAMAIGLPCICTDCLGGGAREIINNGENGLLTPIKDATRLYEAMKAFVTDQALAETCGRNAVKIRDELSADKIAGKWLDIINEISI